MRSVFVERVWGVAALWQGVWLRLLKRSSQKRPLRSAIIASLHSIGMVPSV